MINLYLIKEVTLKNQSVYYVISLILLIVVCLPDKFVMEISHHLKISVQNTVEKLMIYVTAINVLSSILKTTRS